MPAVEMPRMRGEIRSAGARGGEEGLFPFCAYLSFYSNADLALRMRSKQELKPAGRGAGVAKCSLRAGFLSKWVLPA